MKLYNALTDFLYDQKYFITLFENKIHVFGYLELLFLSTKDIKIKLKDFELKIMGNDLLIKQMNNEELIISGNIIEVTKVYD